MHDADYFVPARPDKIRQDARESFFIVGDEHAHTVRSRRFRALDEKYISAPTARFDAAKGN